MPISRRDWLAATGLALAGTGPGPEPRLGPRPNPGPGFDPWLEVDPAALAHNAATVSRLAGGRPILAMVKNNAYGLGLETVGPLLDRLAPIWGFGTVRPREAAVLRAARVTKPVVLMGPASDDEMEELARSGEIGRASCRERV